MKKKPYIALILAGSLKFLVALVAVVGLVTVQGCEKEHTGDVYLFKSDDGSEQQVTIDGEGNITFAGPQSAEHSTTNAPAAQKHHVGRSDLITLSRVWAWNGFWSDTWIDRRGVGC